MFKKLIAIAFSAIFNEASIYYNRAVAKSNRSDHEGAIADYDRAIEIKPDYADAYFFRGNAKAKLGNHDGVEADRKRAIELNPALKDADWWPA